MNDVTRILSAIAEGDAQAAEQLLPLVWEELRKLARLHLPTSTLASRGISPKRSPWSWPTLPPERKGIE